MMKRFCKLATIALMVIMSAGVKAQDQLQLQWQNISTNLPSEASLLDVAYGDGKFVAVGSITKGLVTVPLIMTSTTGSSWYPASTFATLPGGLVSVAFGAHRFVAVGDETYSSVDGVTWLASALPANVKLISVAYTHGRFVGVGQVKLSGSSTQGIIMWSPDGFSWFPSILDSTTPGGFYAVASDGDNSVAATIDTFYQPLHLFNLFGALPEFIWQSGNGFPGGQLSHIRHLGDAGFVAVGTRTESNGTVLPVLMQSADGSSWSGGTQYFDSSQYVTQLSDITSFGGQYYVTTDGANTLMTSTDMQTWTKVPGLTNGILNGEKLVALTSNSHVLIAVGGNNTILRAVQAYVDPGTLPPQADGGSLTAYTGMAVSGTLPATSPANHKMIFAVTSQPKNGTLTVDKTTGAFTYTAGSSAGTDAFHYTAQDTSNGLTSAPGVISITIDSSGGSGGGGTGSSTGVFATDGSLYVYQDTPATGTFFAYSDAGGSLTYNIKATPADGKVSVTGDQFTYTPTSGFSGSDSFTYTATDGTSGTTSQPSTIYVTVQAALGPGSTGVYTTPVASNISYGTGTGTTLQGSLAATSSDGGAIEYQISTEPAHGTVTIDPATGLFTYTPDTGYTGTDTFTYTAYDPATGLVSGSATITVTVGGSSGTAPTLNAGSTTLKTSGDENTPLYGSLPSAAKPGDSLTFSVSSAPTHGVVAINATTGTYSYVPDSGYTGSDSFDYKVTDNSTKQDQGPLTVSITVRPSAPVTAGMAMTTSTGSALSGTVAGISASGDTLSYSIGTKPKHGTLTLDSGNGSFVYTPASGYDGQDSFTYIVKDATSGRSSPANLVTMTVAGTQQTVIPLLAESSSYSVNENVALSGYVAMSAPAGDTLSYSVVTAPTSGTLTLNSTTGAFLYTPNANYTGSDSAVFTVTDTTTGEVSNQAALIFSVSSTAVSTPESGSLSVGASETGTVQFLLPYATEHNATLTITQPTNGTVTKLSGALYSYTANAGYSGQDTFTYTVTDGNTSAVSTAGTVTVSVNGTVPSGAPLVPTAQALNLTVPQGQALKGSVPVYNPDNSQDMYVVSGFTSGGNVTIDSVHGTLTYTPNSSFVGQDNFSYTATDLTTGQASSPGNVSVTVTSGAPLAVGFDMDVIAGRPATATLEGVSPSASSLTYSLSVAPTHGTASINSSTGLLTYIPAQGYTGSDTLAYVATDSNGAVSNPAIVKLSIASGVGTKPVASGLSLTIENANPVTGTLQAYNPSANQMAFASGVPSNGTVSVDQSSGAFTYTPNSGFSGTDSFTYTVKDAATGAQSGSSTVSITVGGSGNSSGSGTIGLISLLGLFMAGLLSKQTKKRSA